MAKTKTPFLSLGSQGTVGQAVTSQKRGSSTLLREKPLPAYRRSLLQDQRRITFGGIGAYWQTLSPASRQICHSAAARRHITGYNLFMSTYLNMYLGSLLYAPLDESAGAIAHDYSGHLAHGTIIGASPASGKVNGCLDYDGLNNYTSFGPTSLFTPTTGLLLIWMYRHSDKTSADCLLHLLGAAGYLNIYLQAPAASIILRVQDTGGNHDLLSDAPLALNTWHRIAVGWTPSNSFMWINTVLQAASPALGAQFNTGTPTLYISNQPAQPTRRLDGLADELIFHPRLLTQAELNADYIRGYPL